MKDGGSKTGSERSNTDAGRQKPVPIAKARMANDVLAELHVVEARRDELVQVLRNMATAGDAATVGMLEWVEKGYLP